MRCWLSPIRPVTPFITMPIVSDIQNSSICEKTLIG
jgi:hypothetical protein